jgi:hypothetical protein
MPLFLHVLVLLACTGCSSMGERSLTITAQPLSITSEQILGVQASKKTFIGAATYESATKCAAFLNHLTGAQASLNANADIASTVLTAIATATTPIRAVHALTAASTIVTGSREAINANLYSKASFATFQVALQQTYYRSLNDYLNDIASVAEQDIDVGTEITKVQTIHATCALAAAEASILATIQPPPAARGAPAAPAVPVAPAAVPGPARAPGGAAGPAPAAPATRGAVVGGRIW